jgi:hypothetical protein
VAEIEATPYGIEGALLEAVRQLKADEPAKRSEAVDRVIRQVGPHQVAHFLTTTTNTRAAESLREYLQRHWPAYLELIERLIQAARRPENEDVMRDFGGD